MFRADSPRITYCTGYWLVSGNAKRTPGYYEKYIPRTIRMISGCRLIVFYSEDAVLDLVKSHAQAHRVAIHGVRVPIPELPAYPYRSQLLQGCRAMKDGEYLADPQRFRKEKGVKHYLRDYRGSGEDNYQDIITIWMSKIPLMAERAITLNPFGSDHFAWIDASIARFKHSRSNWNFMRLSFDEGALYHYDNDTHCMGQPIQINASFLLAHKDIWQRVGDLFRRQLETSIGDPYAHDEETILNLVLKSNPELFKLAGRNYRGYRKAVFKCWHRVEQIVGKLTS